MNHFGLSAALISVLAAGCASVNKCGKEAMCSGSEEKVELANVPAAVRNAIGTAVGGGKLEDVVKETENGLTTYEAEFEVGEVDHSVRIGADGALLEEECAVEAGALPAAVTNAIKKAHPDVKIEDAVEVKAKGMSYFEVMAEVGEADHEIALDAAGNFISDKVVSDEGKEKGNKNEKDEADEDAHKESKDGHKHEGGKKHEKE